MTCEYCGVTQQRVDVEKYVEQLRAEVFGWVRSIVPGGVQNVAQVDPLARSQIFEQSIRQGLSSKFEAMSLQLVKIGSSPLLAPPYAAPSPSLGGEVAFDSKFMLGEAAKFQGLSSLAQSEEQASFLTQATATAETLGYLLNITRIYSEKERSYKTVANNFESAAESLGRDKSRSAGAARMRGLAFMSHAIASFAAGDVRDATEKLDSAEKWMTVASTEVMSQSSLIAWYPGIKAEKGMVGSLKALAEGLKASSAYSSSSADSFFRFGKYMMAFEAAKRTTGKTFSTGSFIEPDIFKEICASFREISLAKAGNPAVNAILGGGAIWVACWLAEINYSFETGMLFMKKGQAVQERLLVSGIFPLRADLIMTAPQYLVTDIFSVQSESGFMDRIKGNEKSLTTGIGFSYLGQTRKASIPYTGIVIPALSTKLEAEKLANIYLEKVRQRLQGKLRIGIPTITQLLYVGGSIRDGRLSVPGLPDSICPYVGDEKALLGFAV